MPKQTMIINPNLRIVGDSFGATVFWKDKPIAAIDDFHTAHGEGKIDKEGERVLVVLYQPDPKEVESDPLAIAQIWGDRVNILSELHRGPSRIIDLMDAALPVVPVKE